MDTLLLFSLAILKDSFPASYSLVFPLFSSSLFFPFAASRLLHPIRMPPHSRVPRTHLCLRPQRRYAVVIVLLCREVSVSSQQHQTCMYWLMSGAVLLVQMLLEVTRHPAVAFSDDLNIQPLFFLTH